MSSHFARRPRVKMSEMTVDDSHKRDYPRVGRRKDEDEVDTGLMEESFPPWNVLDSCQLCWVRFEQGDLVAACECLTEYASS